MTNKDFSPQTPFEGYIKAKLEAMSERLDALPCSDTSKRLSICEQKIANMEGKATVIGLVFGFIGGFVGKLFGK